MTSQEQRLKIQHPGFGKAISAERDYRFVFSDDLEDWIYAKTTKGILRKQRKASKLSTKNTTSS